VPEHHTCHFLSRSQLDISRADLVDSFFLTHQIDAVINAAAYTAVDKAESDHEKAHAVNHLGVLNLTNACIAHDAYLLHISTDFVFNGQAYTAYQPDHTRQPLGIYGKSKLHGEMAIEQSTLTDWAIIRTAWVYSSHGNNFVKTMLRLANTHDTLGIVGDQFGGPTYAGDIASALVAIAKAIHNGESDKFGIYHFSGLPHVSWSQFAQIIFEQAVDQGVLKKLPIVNAITTADYPTPATRPANSKLNTRLISETFAIDASDWKTALQNLKSYT